ncbi:MAG: Ni/Fe hydrogenase subunit alpha [Planctomycetales bacterium]|nr:Ni/Fe hydrogenase subunit alpha [Planctomycetales bacterium]
MSKKQTRTIEVSALTRVEGEGAVRVVVEDGRVCQVQLSIYEPPRFFEALLRGRPLEEVPDITARICGICPIAYQMTAIHALEQALGVEITPEIRLLRRLLYCGEWIESHGVHMHLLHIPDFFGCESSIALAKRFPQEVNRGLRLKKIGNRLLEVAGGRAVHPINVAVGGFYRAPRRTDLQCLKADFQWGLEAAMDVTRWVAGFDFPDLERVYEMVALRHPSEYPMNEGRLASTQGLDIPVDEFENYFAERQVPHSTALQAVRLPTETAYSVGPLARINLNRQLLFPAARQLSDELGMTWPCFNPYRSIVARALEVVHAFEEALSIIDNYHDCAPARIAYQPRAGQGCWATEAPRGMIYHRYRISEAGAIEFASIIPPTSQNQYPIELDLAAYLPSVLGDDDVAAGLACERLIRSYDPCISCATHFLQLEVERR